MWSGKDSDLCQNINPTDQNLITNYLLHSRDSGENVFWNVFQILFFFFLIGEIFIFIFKVTKFYWDSALITPDLLLV